MFSEGIHLRLASVHHERNQQPHDFARCIELTGLGVGGFLRLADDNFEYGTHHGIVNAVRVQVGIVHETFSDLK